MFEARIEDATGEGLYCISPEPFAPLEEVEVEVVIPAHMCRRHRGMVFLLCRAEVVRTLADWRVPGYGIDCRVLDCKIVGRLSTELPPPS